MDRVKAHLSQGAVIKWVGHNAGRSVQVHLYKARSVIKELVELQHDYSNSSFRHVSSSSAAFPRSMTGTIWSTNDRLDVLRLAFILGLNPGADALPGAGKEFRGYTGCIMAYDIEQDRTRLALSSFPTPSESITCIATYCSCGDKKLFSFIPSVEFQYVLYRNSRDTVDRFIYHVTRHSPQWLVGYNNFRYDNTCLAYHTSGKNDRVFSRMRVGAGSSLSYTFYLDIAGVYNIDLLAYLDKTRRGTYLNMSLGTLVEHHGVGKKMDYDTSNFSDIGRLFEYNLHDSRITMELARASSVITEITSLAVIGCSPVIDCARFVSGTIAACSIASYCLANSISMDWSPCVDVKEYRGAEVLMPIIGLHDNVVSCDFSSMYPTVLIGANISLENHTEEACSLQDGAAWSTSSGTAFVIDGSSVRFDRRRDCVIPPVMKLFVDKRKLVKKSNPPYALGLKVAANSIYGSLGDMHSRIYSPNCSAAVTTGGRWCLATAEVILGCLGYKVVYGDTDSCFVAPTEYTKSDIYAATLVLSRIFNFTPFPGMSMEVKNSYSKIAFLGKKTYFGKVLGG